ncbi:hypothetical protein CWM66_27105 [Kosakonia sp. H7A]|uniref:PFGI-1 class ICE element type IV pilus protein PilL2 n=1 Tax=Kosakonia sp. H7A TaxID=2054598 RepID=UPI000D156F44|nr:TcpQ domain-containing protein [Kosakonia sp. H7A]PTA87217.1 hypothetical protein CWM66_27105 [Kosakonia sp. H7A]
MVKLQKRAGEHYRLAGVALCLIAAGCTDSSRTEPLSRLQGAPRVQDVYQNTSPEVVRYDRYTLASTRPADAQRDPLNQIIEIRMPQQVVRTVGEGLRYLLLESGYSLCNGDATVFAELFSKPLPAVQRSVGPVRLTEALQVLAGPAWRLHVDDVNREVCFALRDQYRHFAPTASVSVPGSSLSQGAAPNSGSLLSPGLKPAATGNNSFPLPPARPEGPGAPGTISSVTQAASSGTPKVPRNPFSAGASAGPSPTPAQKTQAGIVSQSASGKIKPSTALAPAPAVLSVPVTPLNTAALGVAPVSAPKADRTVQGKNLSSATPPAFIPGAPLSSLPDGQVWTAKAGTTLKETLTQWASSVHCESGSSPTWVVIWPTPVNYRIDAPFTLRGNFESMIVQLFDLYRKAEKPLYAGPNRLQCLVYVDDKPIQDGQ